MDSGLKTPDLLKSLLPMTIILKASNNKIPGRLSSLKTQKFTNSIYKTSSNSLKNMAKLSKKTKKISQLTQKTFCEMYAMPRISTLCSTNQRNKWSTYTQMNQQNLSNGWTDYDFIHLRSFKGYGVQRKDRFLRNFTKSFVGNFIWKMLSHTLWIAV